MITLLLLSFAKTSARWQVVDLSGVIRRRSRLDDHSPAPPASLLRFLLAGHRELALENLALRHQVAVYKPIVTRPRLRRIDRFFWVGLARVWAGWRRPLFIVTPDTVLAVAAPPLPRALDQGLRPAHPRSPARQRRDQSPDHANDGGQSALGRSTNPWRAAQARPGRGRAHRLAITPEATRPAVADLANVSGQSCPRLGLDRFLHRAHRSAPRPVRLGRAPPPSPARRPLQRHRASHRRLDHPAARRRVPG